MKIKKQSTNKFVVVMVLVATAVIAVTTGITWLMTTRQAEHDRKSAGTVSKQEQTNNHDADVSRAAGDDGGVSKDDNVRGNQQPANKPKVQQFGSDFNADDKNQLSASISALNWSLDTLTIRTTIAQHMDGRKGSCILTLTGPNKLTYSETVDLQDDPQASTCLGYDIPLMRISTKKKLWDGEWRINIKIKAVDKNGRVVGTEINDKIVRHNANSVY